MNTIEEIYNKCPCWNCKDASFVGENFLVVCHTPKPGIWCEPAKKWIKQLDRIVQSHPEGKDVLATLLSEGCPPILEKQT